MNDFRPLILMPSYNTGNILVNTLNAALQHHTPLWLVVDGSDDGSDDLAEQVCSQQVNFTIVRLPKNTGKGNALLQAAKLASQQGFSHILTMDSDGQHPADKIPDLINAACNAPNALIMGNPIFGPDVPLARLKGRKLTIWFTDIETCHCGLGDTLFGMRVYPLPGFLHAFQQTNFARGFDFDPEIAVRMVWLGYTPIQVDIPVKYPSREEGGISHFNYLRDNIKLTFLHFRLIPQWLLQHRTKLRKNHSPK